MRMVLFSTLALARAVRFVPAAVPSRMALHLGAAAPSRMALHVSAAARPAMLRSVSGRAQRSSLQLVRAMADDAAGLGELPAVDENGEPLSKNAQKKLLKAQQIAEKKAAKAAAGGGGDGGGGGGGGGAGAGAEAAVEEASAPWGFADLGVIKSTERPSTVFSAVRELGEAGGPQPGDEVTIRGRLATVRGKGSSAFLVIRSGALHTVQAVFFKSSEFPRQSKAMLSSLQALTEESIVQVKAQGAPLDYIDR